MNQQRIPTKRGLYMVIAMPLSGLDRIREIEPQVSVRLAQVGLDTAPLQ